MHSQLITLRFFGVTSTILDNLPVTIEVNRRDAYLRVLPEESASPAVHGRTHRRLVLGAQRAIIADAALRWKLRQGGIRLQFDLDRYASGSLVGRLSLIHLASLVPIPLYGFQRIGVARLLRARRLLLADDMGLGKTIQVAAAIRELIASGRARNALVVAPATLISNWLKEFTKWTPELVVTVGGRRKQPGNPSWRMLLDQCHVIVTNYEEIRDDIGEDRSLNVDLLVADEAHRLKNWESQTSTAMRQMHVPRVWALTGTPLERDSQDLASLLAFLDRHAFTKSDASLPVGVLRSRAARFVLRREKAQVLHELPPVIAKHQVLHMGNVQSTAYTYVRESGYGDNLLAQFNRLRTICDYDPDTGESTKISRIVSILRNVVEKKEKAVVFSYILEPLRLLLAQLREVGIVSTFLEGSMNIADRRTVIRRFRQGNTQVLLASMRIASEGLTLVEANHVVFVNRWWNPSLNQQAIDRVVRIGQHRPVSVYTFTLRDTIEEDLDRLLQLKKGLFDELIGQLKVDGSDIEGVLGRIAQSEATK